MCGIAGLISDEADLSAIRTMAAALRHRGPDDTGDWSEGRAALGHTRLSIIDLSAAGHQPMVLGDLVLVYNGEIYNFRELARGLPGPFRSHTDSEVLLHLYARDGEDCLRHLNGMFAFAIWDRRRRRLFAARDRMGIKPFVYRELPCGGFAFASEHKALLPLGKPPIDRSAVRDYLLYGYIPAPKTIYAGIAKLPAAHALVWQDGRVQVRRYWAPSAEIRHTDEADAMQRLDELLATIMPEHTLADVPVGVFLSGGIDSPTMAWYLDRPKTYTLGFDSKSHSEAEAARAVAAHFGTDHHEISAGPLDMGLALATMPRIYDEPFGDSAGWSAYLISQLARRDVTVALSGEGGDELFCGYRRYWEGAGTRSNALNRALARRLPPLSRLGHSMQRRAARGLEGFAALLGGLLPRQLRELLTDEYLDSEADDLWFFRQYWREDLHPTQAMRWLDVHTNLAEGLLTKVDRASMAHSLEVRPPFLDHRLVEFALSLHPELLVDAKSGRGKMLVRRLMEKRLPAGHLERSKRGFGLPVHQWVRQHPELLEQAQRRLLDAGILRRRVSADFRRIWYLLVLDQWLSQCG
jgi:asparagine synthase (glutamine-hydrolysing)